jgi:hypothetical protein
LIGPSHGALDALERVARFLHTECAVDRAVYLGVDGALDRVVLQWATTLVDGNPDESAIFTRAARCIDAPPEEIEAFLTRERERRALRVFESLPGDGTRVIEILDGKLAVMIHDKADLDEEDMLPAAFLIFGASKEPVIRQVGSRWFLSPGALTGHGLLLLEDQDEGVQLRLFDAHCREQRKERITTAHVARLRVDGG